MTTNEFLEATTNCTFFKVSPANYISENVVREKVVCKDGFVISIQANVRKTWRNRYRSY